MPTHAALVRPGPPYSVHSQTDVWSSVPGPVASVAVCAAPRISSPDSVRATVAGLFATSGTDRAAVSLRAGLVTDVVAAVPVRAGLLAELAGLRRMEASSGRWVCIGAVRMAVRMVVVVAAGAMVTVKIEQATELQ